MRGSGPGGQGTNSSSNKVELRVDLGLLAGFFDEEVIAALIANEAGKHVSADHATLVVSCHEHRSALQNKEGCLQKVRVMLQAASWVPPVERDPVERPTHIVTQQKQKRRIKSNMNHMKKSARKGQW
ncbi:ribosome-associated protein [Strigomonas culicis]|uniref:Ribosome-associated protein n=1 Tax=Strigomonas culicis TaxID=28005 RepID=S9UTH0_9TRYP|nr:ribosome-associated protein [Strigomonas culicis]|eukprot:EPY34247.1 ribosome-associated protein [Strigomonas culicis]